MAENGVVLFVAIQRAIAGGQSALARTTQRTAGDIDSLEEAARRWRQVAGPTDVLSSEFALQAGVYRDEVRLFAVNRASEEDQSSVLSDAQVDSLFDGLRSRGSSRKP